MSTVGKPWAYVRETLLALTVIALTFLNYGHVSVTASGDFRIVPDSWCGDPLLPDAPKHSPCHACRVGGAALPPAPNCVEPVVFGVAPVAYTLPTVSLDPPPRSRPAQPRGPPALV